MFNFILGAVSGAALVAFVPRVGHMIREWWKASQESRQRLYGRDDKKGSDDDA